MKKRLFQITDPQQYLITLNEETWTDHILQGHPEMGRLLEELKNTIGDPDLIYQQLSTNPKSVVYRKIIAEEHNTAEYIHVAAKRSEKSNRGYVKTAWSGGTPEPSGAQIMWTKK